MSRSETSAVSSKHKAEKGKTSGSSRGTLASQEVDAEASASRALNVERLQKYLQRRNELRGEGLPFTLEEALALEEISRSSGDALSDKLSSADWESVRSCVVELLSLDSPDEHLAYIRKQISGASPEHVRQK